MYLGIDCNTQSLSAVVVDAAKPRIVHAETIWYDEEFPEYHSPKGILPNDDPLVKCANPLLWLDALERLFERLSLADVDLSRIDGIAGSAQHGTVYLNGRFLENDWLEHASTLSQAMSPLLSRSSAPIWMDSSTFDDCLAIEFSAGGRQAVQDITGSVATERFAAPQIHRFVRLDSAGYHQTAVIHPVSSFMCSALLGRSASMDYGEGSSTNLMDLRGRTWNSTLLQATAPELDIRLPGLVSSSAVLGVLHPYFRKFGFRDNVDVLAWSSDHLMRLIGIGGWRSGVAGISLGTCDTYFSAMDKIGTDPAGCGHVSVNPAGNYMSTVCFKNGSLAREHVCGQYGLNWSQFDNDAFELTPPGNGGNMMLPYFTPEITPLVLNARPFFKGNSLFVSQKDPSAIVRALVEAQAMSMRIHSRWIGNKPKCLCVTGGASRSPGMCQVYADVFNAAVQRPDVEQTAALGSAIRAIQSLTDWEWHGLTKALCTCDSSRIVRPVEDNADIYSDLIQRYAEFEREITG